MSGPLACLLYCCMCVMHGLVDLVISESER